MNLAATADVRGDFQVTITNKPLVQNSVGGT